MARKHSKRAVTTFGSINPFANANPVVKAEDIKGIPVYVVGARGPYQSRKYENEYCVLTLEWAEEGEPAWPALTPEQQEKFLPEHWQDDGLRDLMLSYVGQRKSIVELFAENPSAVLGPGQLVPEDVGSVSDMWLFADLDAE